MSKNLPALPDKFRETALALPDKIKASLAAVQSAAGAADMLDQAEVMSQYARRICTDQESVNAIQYAKLLIVAKLGELMEAKTPSERGAMGGRGNKASSPPELAFAKATLATYRKVASNGGRIDVYRDDVEHANATLPDDTPIENAAALKEVSLSGFIQFIASGGVRGCLTGEIEWYTPKVYVEAARKTMGSIDLDPASCKVANKTVRAKKFFDEERDGLDQPWTGNVFLNPPYKAMAVAAFVNKLCDEVASEGVGQAILLTNNATDTQWWHRAARECAAVCLTEGRISFENSGDVKKSPPNGHSFFYFGERLAEFSENFTDVGLLVQVATEL